ncbi:hypothetical protein D3C80_854310 [compost metagenome]
MTLEAERALVGALDPLQGTVEQRLVNGAHVTWQGGFIDCEAVVLTGDHYHASVQVLDWVVGAMVTMTHFHGLGTGGQGQQLVAQADTEHWGLGFEDFLDRLDRVVAWLRITRAVGQEHAIRVECQDFAGRGLCRHDGQAAAASNQHAQDVQLDAKVVGDHVVWQLGGLDGRVTVGFQLPDAGAPFIAGLGADHFGQVHALEAREAASGGNCSLFADVVAGQDAAVLRALLTQDARQATRVDPGDRNHVVGFEVVRQRLLVAPVAGNQRQITNDQTGRPDTVGLGIFRRGAGIANVRVSQGNDLLRIGRVSQDFLIAGHCGVKHHLTNGLTVGSNGFTAKNAAISKGEYGWLSQEDLP